VAYNIDADPANANWLRRKNRWSIPAENLAQLLEYLGVLDQPREVQYEILTKFMATDTYGPSPLLLKQQADEFINGFELEDVSQELKEK
jgi:hypothetical protein